MDLILTNQLLGTRIGGEYGSLVLIPQTIRIFITTISGTISPIQMEKYAKQDFEEVAKLTTFAIKILGFSLGILIGIICGYSKLILLVWLGKDFVHLNNILPLLLIPLLLTLPFQPLFQLQVAFNKVKIPSLFTLILGITNLFFSILLVKNFSLGLEGIAISFGLTYIIRTSIFTPIYGSHIQSLKNIIFLKQIFPTILVFMIIYFVSTIYLTKFLNYPILLVSLQTITLIILSLFLYKLLFSKNEKLFLIQFIRKEPFINV